MTRWTPQGSSEAGHSVDDPQRGGQEQEAALLRQRTRWTSGSSSFKRLAKIILDASASDHDLTSRQVPSLGELDVLLRGSRGRGEAAPTG